MTSDPGVVVGREEPPPIPAPCPSGLTAPSIATGSFCGPKPERGNGNGPDGLCDGTETAPPCGPGVVTDKYYDFTLPGNCGVVRFDGRYWVSELPPPRPVPNSYVWMAIGPGGAGWIGPDGAVGFKLDDAAPPSCTRVD